MQWLRIKFRKWLRIDKMQESLNGVHDRIAKLYKLNKDLASIGVDVHFKEPHKILIYTRLGGGQICEVPVTFDNLRELNECVDMLRQRYNTSDVLYDTPHGMKEYLNGGMP